MTITYEIESIAKFQELLLNNTGIILIKFGADWCGPCKKIESFVKESFNKMPENINCIIVDVDESFELYAFLKNKKMIQGIPAILAYVKGNVNYVPNDMVSGADVKEINLFFERIFNTYKTL